MIYNAPTVYDLTRRACTVRAGCATYVLCAAQRHELRRSAAVAHISVNEAKLFGDIAKQVHLRTGVRALACRGNGKDNCRTVCLEADYGTGVSGGCHTGVNVTVCKNCKESSNGVNYIAGGVPLVRVAGVVKSYLGHEVDLVSNCIV